MPDVVEPVAAGEGGAARSAARALFAATEMVSSNKFETEFGRTRAAGEVWRSTTERYQARSMRRLEQVAANLTRAYQENRGAGRSGEAGGEGRRCATPGVRRLHDSARLGPKRTVYCVRSAGPDRQFDTRRRSGDVSAGANDARPRAADSAVSRWTVRSNTIAGRSTGARRLTGTVMDATGAAVAGATVTLREASPAATTRTATPNADGQFTLAGLPAGDYEVRVSAPGFKTAAQNVTLQARDRAVVSAVLQIGAVIGDGQW